MTSCATACILMFPIALGLRFHNRVTATMNGQAATSSYLERLEAFRKADTERDAMVAEVIRKYEELKSRYNDKCDDLNNEVESRRMWQGKAREHESALQEQRLVSVRRPLFDAKLAC